LKASEYDLHAVTAEDRPWVERFKAKTRDFRKKYLVPLLADPGKKLLRETTAEAKQLYDETVDLLKKERETENKTGDVERELERQLTYFINKEDIKHLEKALLLARKTGCPACTKHVADAINAAKKGNMAEAIEWAKIVRGGSLVGEPLPNKLLVKKGDKMKPIEEFLNNVICGNCLDIMKQFPSESLDMVMFSPHQKLLNILTYTNIIGMSELSREMLAYLAGVIDADGCIRIKKSTWNMRKRSDVFSPAYEEWVQLKQRQPEVVSILKRHFGGTLYKEKRTRKDGKLTVMYVWNVRNKQAANFLRSVVEFLILKKKQGELCLELRKSKESKEARMRGGMKQRRKMPREVLEKRERLFQEIKKLNSFNWMKAQGLDL